MEACKCVANSQMMERKRLSRDNTVDQKCKNCKKVDQVCMSCKEGEFAADKFSPMQAACKNCPAGRYQSAEGHVNEECLICPMGKYQSEEGKSECTTCGAGMTTRARFTEDGCECKKEWEQGDTLVDDYCGNPDNDASGDWCMKKDPFCGNGEDRGTCATGV